MGGKAPYGFHTEPIKMDGINMGSKHQHLVFQMLVFRFFHIPALIEIASVYAERETIQKRVTDAYYSRSQRGFKMGGKAPYGFLSRTNS